MHSSPMSLNDHYELRFDSLFQAGRALAFPCDAAGTVSLDALSDQARHNYLFARTVVGRDFARPVVQRCSPPPG